MKNFSLLLNVFIFSILALLPAAAFAQEMTLEQCMETAVAKNKELIASGYAVQVKEAEKKSMFGHFLPGVTLEGNVLVWDDEIAMGLGDSMSALSGLFDVLGELLTNQFVQGLLSDEAKAKAAGLQSSAAEMQGMGIKVRDQVTASAKVTIAQPLTQLYKVYSGYSANKSLYKAAEYDRLSTRQQLELNVTKAYLGLITATKMVETVKAGLKQVEAYEDQVKAYLDAQVVERNALLKVQVRKADIQKTLFMAEKAVKIASATLNLLMGRSLDTPLEPVIENPLSTPEKLLEPSLKTQQRQALNNRPELLSISAKKEAAHSGKHAAIASLVPELSAVFQYQYSYGYGATQPENVYFGGLILTWDAWDWGVEWYEMRSAEYQEKQVATLLSYAGDGIQLDIEKKRLELEEALKSQKVAEAQLEQATENLRIEQIRFDVQETTTTDLLDAQTQHLKAENDSIAAENKVRETYYELLTAMGTDLLEKKEVL